MDQLGLTEQPCLFEMGSAMLGVSKDGAVDNLVCADGLSGMLYVRALSFMVISKILIKAEFLLKQNCREDLVTWLWILSVWAV